MIPSAGGGRVLDFDIENRPLSYWVPDMPTAEITSISWMWTGDHDSLTVRALGEVTYEQMLGDFVSAYNEADLVTGHYIRRHDLPIINGALYESGLPLLQPKMTCDTKLDMFKKADLPATQEFLLELLGTECPLGIVLEKYHMTQVKWREANRLTPGGIAQTKRRVTTDVHAHVHMREDMIKRGWLRPPSMWRPGGGYSEVSEGRHR
jgi:hypothetical protein